MCCISSAPCPAAVPDIAASASDSEKAAVRDSSNRFIDSFQRLAHDHYQEEHDVGYYAGRLAITPNYLNKIVRASLDTSTKKYLQLLLLDEARRQLLYTALSIEDISGGLNFETTSYFIRFFRMHTGMTPLEFRKKKK